MVKKKKKDEECYYCKSIVEFDEDKYVVLETFNKFNSIERCVFHINCWKDYYKASVREKVESIKDKFKFLIPKIKQFAPDLDLSMISKIMNTDLDKISEDIKKITNKKEKKDGRKKRKD